MLTNQQVFDKAVQHLTNQGCKAIDQSAHCQCRYRIRRDGRMLKCAIGAFIRNEDYNPIMEGHSVADLFEKWPDAMENAGLSKDQLPLLKALQRCHDARPMHEWPVVLLTIAGCFDLSEGFALKLDDMK